MSDGGDYRSPLEGDALAEAIAENRRRRLAARLRRASWRSLENHPELTVDLIRRTTPELPPRTVVLGEDRRTVMDMLSSSRNGILQVSERLDTAREMLRDLNERMIVIEMERTHQRGQSKAWKNVGRVASVIALLLGIDWAARLLKIL